MKLPGADTENQLAALKRIVRMSEKLQSRNLNELKPSWRICTGHFEQDSFFPRGLGFWKYKDVWKLKGEDEFERNMEANPDLKDESIIFIDSSSDEQNLKPSDTEVELEADEDSAILHIDDISHLKKSQIKSYCQFCLRRQTEGESVSIDDEIMKNFNLLTQQKVGKVFLLLAR